MRYLLLMFFFSISFAQEKNAIPSPQMLSETTRVKIAFVDTSDISIEFLNKASPRLIENKIPVMLLGGNDESVKKLSFNYPGLIVGTAPKPRKFLELLLKQLQITSIPALVEGESVWEYKPKE